MDQRIDNILDFWFGNDLDDADAVVARFKTWFAGGDAFDRQCRDVLGGYLAAGLAGAYDHWPVDAGARGALALIVLLDQVPRNIHRGTSDAFVSDAKALALCLAGIDDGSARTLHAVEQFFYYMPTQHAEELTVQRRGVEEYRQLAERTDPPLRQQCENCHVFAIAHLEIIEQFGRFPHRNAILGRASTTEEIEYMSSGGDSFGQ